MVPQRVAPPTAEEYGGGVSTPARVVIGEDDVLLREGIARLLVEAGFEVVAQAGDALDLVRKALAYRPDVTVADIQMPPGHGDDGLRAALELRGKLPKMGVLVLSQYYEEQYALDLIGDSAEGVGYLLKERVGDVDAFTDAVARVAAGGSALDPEVVGRMLGRRRREGALDRPHHPGRRRTGAARRPHHPRARRAGAARRGQVEPRHRRGPGDQQRLGREARHQHLPEARP